MFGADNGAAGAQFGTASAQDVADLNKALATSGDNAYSRGGDVGASVPGGSPLRVESLESTLKVTTYSERHIVFWRDLPKLPAFNTVEEFNQLNSYGNQGGSFVPEGIAPESSDSRYDRKTVQIKYLGVQRAVTHVMTLVRPAHGDVIALETLNGTRELLRRLEEALFWGDSAMVSQEWDGLYKQLTDGFGSELVDDTQNIIDMRGQPLDEKVMGEAARIIIDNYGFPTQMYLGFQTLQDLNNTFFARQRTLPQQDGTVGPAGFNLESFQTVGGVYGFRPSVFLRPGRDLPTASVGPVGKIPSASGVTITGGTPASDAASKMGAVAQTYSYTLENRFGETLGGSTAAVSYAAGESALITVASLPSDCTAVNLFREVTGAAGRPKHMKRIAKVSSSATFTDRDLFMPGMSSAFLLQVDLDVMSFKQLAPFTKIPLATIDPSIRWMQLLYGTPAIYQPKKNVVIRNIGRL